MWNDVLSLKGRRNKVKYIIICMILALAALMTCIFSAFPLYPGLRLQGLRPVELTKWIPADCTPDSRSCLVGEIDVDYVPGERSVVLLSAGGKRIHLPGAVDAVIPGEDAFGVILSGSGYLTNTVIYDSFGNKLSEMGFVEEAMWNGCFLGNSRDFAALTFGIDGLWRVRYHLEDGELLWQYPFESGSVPGICSLGDRGVLITDEEILMFDDTGEVASVHSFGVWEPCLTASGREILAVVTMCRGEHRIMTVSSSGEILGQWELSQKPEDVKLSAGKVFVLDTGNFLVYDAFGKLHLSSQEGARAGKLETTENCVWLIGNGELMQIETS